ncbi:MAG TPA: SDR family oxidoreductase [Solirubrobacteraceae bacterium]|jgi:NAD(P)-dependent dehydrogenase (short-subunit alcohol dehydrogenase family)|nr:SDR family oxidoreductase [Solirubrobacteraceae bacterium]
MTSTVFITGAARGVGRACALAFAQEKANLLLADVCAPIEECPYPLGTEEQLQESARRCRALGARVSTAVVDVREQSAIDDAVARAHSELGKIDALVNNAGLVGPAGATAHELAEHDWTTMIDIDLSGPWRCAKAVLPDMIERRGGAIVNVASTAGLVAFPFFSNYVAAKHGLIGLTRALALDYAPQAIRVNAVCPTSVQDDPELDSAMLAGVASMMGVEREDYEALSLPHHPLGSLVSAADVAAAIVWLCSPGARHVTGATIPVDAGFTAR